MSRAFTQLLQEVRSCRRCENQLPAGPRPVLQVARSARVLIAGQAPGMRVHASGVPFDDASGERLRDWMGIDKSTFYDAARIAILPMGFCYPGTGKSGDLPPLPQCAQAWRQPLLSALDGLRVTLVIGQYAQRWHLTEAPKTLTATVKAWADYGSGVLPLPHPSPRNNIWMKKNPWFAAELLPELKERVRDALTN